MLRGQPTRKILVVIDNTTECRQALRYAIRLTERSGGSVVALCVVAEQEFEHWLGVQNLMREDALREAEDLLDKALAEPDLAVDVERIVEIGLRGDVIRKVIDKDTGIVRLVLAANSGSDGPGPLVTNIVGSQAGNYPVPITIVPSGLGDTALDALA